ncbi:MAG: UDP-glucose 4-epimerase GalE [Eubacteriales bacterium]|nr:UDP-glucose 4-epimerase GalE [Eubacteriales bacterium]
MKILVTGGTGYIGSHTCVELINAGHDVIIVDNLYNSSEKVVNVITELTGKRPLFYQVDIRDEAKMDNLFQENPGIDCVIHFAGLKAVGESVEKPLFYYDNNVAGTITLTRFMAKHGIKNIIFSSSATVYGDPATVPITEDFPLSVTNPYGRTKLMIEEILRDLQVAEPRMNVILLRYFNPIGAHESGKLGEDPNGVPNNLVPYIAQVAVGKLERLRVFGDDYPTPDGTGVRDYIHVTDLAKGHVCALQKCKGDGGIFTYNLGTGHGYSVLEVVHAFEAACGKQLPYEIAPRRPGDIATCYADAAKAKAELGWHADLGMERMCADHWRWQKNNPNGFRDR